ncbi:MAG: universal stress protein [Candidatus Latescibacteria bacterium]|nr:universal stress protein [Candidatus Latescibacterota bacterium]
MIKIKKILCPTDFSTPSIEALKIANDMALSYSAKLYIVNIVTPVPLLSAPPAFTTSGIPGSIDLVAYRKSLEESAKTELEKLLKKSVSKKIKAVPIIAYGDAAEQILNIADKEKIDLVVIATHGRTGWKHFVFGSVAEKVIRLAKQPVLTIRKPNNQ